MTFSYFSRYRKKTLLVTAVIVCLLAYLIACLILKHTGHYIDNKEKDSELVTILKGATSTLYFPIDHVVDGDTFVIKVDSGNATVRPIGMNTPETVDPRKPVECFGPEASARGHELLDGQDVSLKLDSSQNSLDKYGRVLAYVYLENGIFYNKEMIDEGYAYEYTYKTKYSYQQNFRDAQHTAKNKDLGLWAKTTCNGKK